MTFDYSSQTESGKNETVKRPYAAPELKEYGDISELVKSGSGTGVETVEDSLGQVS